MPFICYSGTCRSGNVIENYHSKGGAYVPDHDRVGICHSASVEIEAAGTFFKFFNRTVTEMFGERHGFSIFLSDNLDFMKEIKEVRNGFDHRVPEVSLKDYTFNPDRTVSLPSISLNSKDAKCDAMPVTEYLNKLESIFSFAEVLICHLAHVTIPHMGGEIKEIPVETRRYKYVRYCFYLPGLDFFQQ